MPLLESSASLDLERETVHERYFAHWDVAFGGDRAIAHGLGMGEENWNNVHKDARFEIVPNMTFAIRVNFVAIESQGIHFEDALVVTETGSRFSTRLLFLW